MISLGADIWRGVVGVGRLAYSPLAMFMQGQQGAWYDPSDLSTLFQDAAGTIPVTATGQPVGLMLDKSGRGNHASQATAASRPIFRDVGGLRYLECDGVDDGMVTGSIDFTGTDKMLVCAGVRKLSDAAVAVVVELSADASANRAFNLLSDVGTFRARSTGSVSAQIFSGAAVAPVSAVVTAQADIAAPSQSIKLSGAVAVTGVASMGTGNYGNYPLYLFRRGGASLPFSGLFYGAIIAGAAYSASQIASAERYLAGKSGVTL